MLKERRVFLEKISFYAAKLIRRLNKPAIRASKIDKTSVVCSGSQVNRTTMGKYSYIGNNCFTSNTKIGAFCSIADNCFIGGAAHPLNFVSTSPVFHKGKNIMNKNFSCHEFKTSEETTIGNDVWLGAGVTVLSGVKIGNGAVVGAGSVVTKNIGDYEIWAGNPAKCIRKRFSDEVTEELARLEWWNWNEEKIATFSEYFNEPEKLIGIIKEN